MDIEVLPPDVNSSDHDFVVAGSRSASASTRSRTSGTRRSRRSSRSREGGGPFESIWDFCERVDSRTVNKRAIESLVKCGALDSRATRGGACSRSSARLRRPAEGAGGLASRTGLDLRSRRRRATDASPAAGVAAPRHPSVSEEEFDQRELLRLEKETLGTFVSAHPLAEVRGRCALAWTARSPMSRGCPTALG